MYFDFFLDNFIYLVIWYLVNLLYLILNFLWILVVWYLANLHLILVYLVKIWHHLIWLLILKILSINLIIHELFIITIKSWKFFGFDIFKKIKTILRILSLIHSIIIIKRYLSCIHVLRYLSVHVLIVLLH